MLPRRQLAGRQSLLPRAPLGMLELPKLTRGNSCFRSGKLSDGSAGATLAGPWPSFCMAEGGGTLRGMRHFVGGMTVLRKISPLCGMFVLVLSVAATLCAAPPVAPTRPARQPDEAVAPANEPHDEPT